MPIKSCPSHQRGLTLIELMISITIGLFILTGLVYMLSSSMNTNTKTLRSTRLNQELRAAMQLITHDLKRAGGSGRAEQAIQFSAAHGLQFNAPTGTITVTALPSGTAFDSWVDTGVYIRAVTLNILNGTTTNSCISITTRNSSTQLTGSNVACPNESIANAMPATTISQSSWVFENLFNNSDFLITDAANSTDMTYNCVMFRYDLDKDNALDASETIGFRYDANDKAIETWSSGTASCSAGTWANLTDEKTIQISDLTVTRLTPIGSNLTEFKVVLTGNLVTDTSYNRTIEEVVRIRNDLSLDL
jgi:prepilin-type N-terminal cleavage/methylation domain-containing protein